MNAIRIGVVYIITYLYYFYIILCICTNRPTVLTISVYLWIAASRKFLGHKELAECVQMRKCSPRYREILEASVGKDDMLCTSNSETCPGVAIGRGVTKCVGGFMDMIDALLSREACDRPECFELVTFLTQTDTGICENDIDGTRVHTMTEGGGWVMDVILNDDY